MAAFGTFERMMATRYLRARRQEGFISVIAWFSLIGIALGVATLIIVMSVMNGFRHELITRIVGFNGHVTIYSNAGPVPDYDEVTRSVRGLVGVTSAAPIIDGQVMATASGVATGALVRGVRSEDLKSRRTFDGKLRSGKLDTFDDDEVVIGYRLSQKLRVGVGDKLTLVAPTFQATALGSLPRTRAYTIGAIFDVGMAEIDGAYVFMPLEAAQVFFRLPEAASGVEVMLENPTRVDEFRAVAQGRLGPNYRLFDWQQANASIMNAVKVERNVMFLILTLIILVAAFNIISSLIMLVKDKTRDIAILRTMGATPGAVMRVFFMSGAAVGVLGTVAGFGLGLSFALNIETIRRWIEKLSGAELFSAEIYFLSQLPSRVEPPEVIAVVLMAIGLCFLATLYPSWRASRLDPVEALRYE
ncbi:MAG: lipoprotein-releasing ABC transporter permease subunit [Alphaproteobacteria bacterium]|nr:lipoprotein-releasing ABC transporter permease subunit [Alphaproteobacteria bacterium]